MRTRTLSCHLSRSGNIWRLIVGLTFGLRFLGVHGVALAGEASADVRPQNNYSLVLQVTPKEGPAERFSFVSAGGRFEASFVSGQADMNGTAIPMISSLKAEFEPLQDTKVWLGQLSLTHTVPYVTGFTEYGGASPSPAGSRTRTIRSGDEGGKSADSAKPAEPSPPGATRTMTRSVVQQANVGITTSLVLTIGKTITLFEDSRQQIKLTVNKVED